MFLKSIANTMYTLLLLILCIHYNTQKKPDIGLFLFQRFMIMHLQYLLSPESFPFHI
jgi:hypothetical protein